MTTSPPIVALPTNEQAAALREALHAPDDGIKLEQAAVIATDAESYHARRRGLQQVIRLALLELSKDEYRKAKPIRLASRVGW